MKAPRLKNLSALLPVVTDRNWPNIFFGCDDRHPSDLIAEGGIDSILRKAVAAGLDPVRAVQMATINPARHFNLRGLGGIAPGYQADLVVINSLKEFRAEMVYKKGKPVCRDGRLLSSPPSFVDTKVLDTVKLPPLTGRLGTVGLVKGFGPIKGALTSTVAHDSHNLILIGTNEIDMKLAARTAAEMGGGLVVVSGGRVLSSLALPVAGLMSDKDAAVVSGQYEKLHQAAVEIGCTLPSPFMTMSFLALP